MASAFNLTAQLNLVGPTNVGVIIADIRRQLGTINGNIKFQIDPSAIANTARLNRGLLTLNSTLDQTGVSARNAVSAIRDLGKAVTSIGGANSAAQAINNAAKATSSLNNTCQQAAAGARGAGSEMQEFGKQAGLAVRRFSAFSIVTSAIFAVTGAMKQGIAAFIEFDQQFVKLRQVTGESTEGLKGLASTITSLSTGLGASSAELTNVASTLAQAGLSARDTERALKALALSSLAPSFSDMNQTVEGSIALMRQFGISAKDLESSLGAINSVSAKFAVESRDIIAAIQRTGGVFASASRGVSEGKDALNEFIAVFTSVRATTRESAETIATGLRTIFTRIQRGGTIEALKEYGVNLTDLDGKFVGAYKAVQLLSEGLNNIDPRDLKFSEIIEQLGGFRQIGKVIPLIQQFATTQDALKVAQQGQGSLAKDAALAQLSLANQVSKVREEFLALFREIGGSDTFQTMAKGALSVASAIIKVADSMKGVLPVLAALIAMKGASAIFQFGTGFAQGVGRSGGARGLGSRVGGGGMAQGGVIRAFARGGVVPGSGSGDTVPAMLEPGEFVIRKRAVQSLGSGNLHRMNKSGGGKISGYAVGGKVKISDLDNQSAIDNAIAASGTKKIVQKGDTVKANLSKENFMTKSQTEGGDPGKEQYLKNIGKQMRAANPDAPAYQGGGANPVWDAAYEQWVKNKLGRGWNRTGDETYAQLKKIKYRNRYPVDLIGPNGALGEVKFRNEGQVTDNDFISKLLRARLKRKQYPETSTGFTTDENDSLADLGKLHIFEVPTLEQYSQQRQPKGKNSIVAQINKQYGGEIQKFAIGGEASPTLVGVPDNLAKAKAFQATTASDVAKKFLRKKLPTDSAFAQYAGADITNDLIKSAWRADTKLPNIKNYLQEGMAKDAARIKEAKDQEIARSYKFGLVGLAPLGYSDTIGPQTLSKTSSTIFAKGLPKAYEKAIGNMREKLGGAVNSFATDIQTTGITYGNKNIALDFDETLFGGADLFDKNGKIDIEGYSDLNRVMSGLNKGHITPLGSKIKELIGLDPSFLNRLSVLTARPQSNAGLLAAKLNEIGIPIPINKIVGTSGGGSRKADAMTKAQKLVDDNLENIKAVRGRGLEGVAYAPVKGLTEDQKKAAGFAGAEGNILEATLAALGATGGSIQSRAVDYEHGLGVTAAQYFPGLNPTWPTEVKRTINGDSISDAKEQFAKWLKAKGMARGGKVDFEKGVGESPFSKASSSNKLGQAAYALQKNSGLNDLEFNNIKQFADSAGYNLEEFKTYLAKRIEQKRSKAGLRSDGASLLESLKIPAKTSTNSQLALAAQLQEGATPTGYAAGNTVSADKKTKNYGKIALRDSGASISATYFKNDERSGSVTANKMKDNLYYVGLSAATKGYGPKLYDAVMEAASEHNAMLTSDRNSVSGSAKSVWDYYFNSRPDVKKTPLDPSDWTRNQAMIDPKLFGPKTSWPPATDPAWILQSGYSKNPTLINSDSVVRLGGKEDPRSMVNNFFAASRARKLASGGAISDTVPAMLTPGEFVINKKAAQNIGYGKLRQMNHADKVQGFASGGAVGDYEFSNTISKSSPAAEAAMEALIAKLVAQITKASPGISVADARKQATEQTTGPVSFGLKTAAETGDQKAAKAVYEAQRKQVVSITKEIRSMDKSISVSDARIAAEAKVGDAWGGLMTKIKSTPMPKGPGAGTPTDAEKAEALDRKRARRQMIGMGVGMAIPLAASMLTTDKPQSAGEARTNSLVSGISSTAGSAAALMGQGKFGVAAGVGVAAYGFVQALADAENAANEFAKTQASSKLEAANEKATASLELFGKNLKDGALGIKATTDVLATIKAADMLASTKETTYRGVANLSDTGEGSSQRGEILKREGILSYLSTTKLFGGASAKANQASKSEQYIPEMSREKAKDYSSASQSSTLLLESKIKSGESIATLKQQPLDFSNLTKSLALADSAVQESILVTQNRTDIDQAAKTIINQELIARVAENKAREIQTRVLREKAIENLNKGANTLTNSLERMFQTMEQSINKSSFNIERLGHQADLTSAALSGTAKIGSTQLNAINVLQNPRVSSSRESKDAIKLASSAYGSEANNVAGIMKLAISLEDTMMKSINSTLKTTNKSDTNEAVGVKLQSAIAASIADLQLPPDLSSKLAAEVGASVAEIRKSGDSKLDFSQLIEKIPMLGKVIDSSKRSFEAAIKVLEHFQKAFTEYSNSLNKVIDIQVDNANRLRTANALVFNGLLELNKALGKTASIATIQRSVSLTTQSMTGGATAPADIGRNIRGLENQRKTQQAASNAAAEAKDVGGFKLMQDGLVKTGVALRQNYEALKHLSESTVVASAAMAKISELQQKNQAGVNIVEKLVTSSPEDLQNLNRSMVMLTNNMQGRVNLGSTAEDRKGSLDAFQMIAPLLGENQNKMKANVLEAMLQESGMGNNPMMNDILASLRNPAVDPAMAEAIGIYKASLEVQRGAHVELIKLNKLSAENTSEIAAQQLKTALEGTPLTFENQQLVDIAAGIQKLVEFGKPLGQAQGKAVGGLIYASGGQRVDFKPQGTDTVPAMLTPGEFVINKAATSKNLPLLKSINGGFSKGGSVGYYNAGGYVFDNPWHHTDKDDAVRQAKTPDKQTSIDYPKIHDLKASFSDPIIKYKSAPSDLFAASVADSAVGDPMPYDKQVPTIGIDIKNVPGYGYNEAAMNGLTGNQPVTGYPRPNRNSTVDSLSLPPASINDNLDFARMARIKESEKTEYLAYYEAIFKKYFSPMGDIESKEGDDNKITSNNKNIYLNPSKYADEAPAISPTITSSGLGKKHSDHEFKLSGLSRPGNASDLLGLYPGISTSRKSSALGFSAAWDLLGSPTYSVVGGTEKMTWNNAFGAHSNVHPGAERAHQITSDPSISLEKLRQDISHKKKLGEYITTLGGDKFSSVTKESESNIGFINKLRNLYGKVSPFETFKPTEINNTQAGTEDTSLYNMGQVEWDKIIKKISSDKSIKAYAKSPTDYIGIMPVDPMGPSSKFPWASPNIDKDSLEQHQDAFKKRKLIKLVSKKYDDGNGTQFPYNQFEGANGPRGPLYDTVGGFFDTNQTDSFSIMPGARTDPLNNPFAEADLNGQDIILSPFLDHAKMGMLLKRGRANWAKVKWPVKKKISGVTGYDADTNENAYPTGAASTITDLMAPKFWDAYDARKVDAQNQDLAKDAEEQQTRGFEVGGRDVGVAMSGIRNLNSVKKIIQKTLGPQIAPIRGAGFNLYPLSNIEKLGTYASDLTKLQTVFGQKIRTTRDKSGKTIGVNEAQAKAWGVIGAASESFAKISSKDFLGLFSLLNLNPNELEDQKTPYKIDKLSNSINQYGGLLSSSAIQKITTKALLDQDLEAADKKTVESMFADKQQSDQMRMGDVDKKSGKVTYRPMNAEDSPKTLRDLGAKALNPYSTFGDGQREGLLHSLFNSLIKDSAGSAMATDVVTAGEWLINQDAVINGTDKGVSSALLNNPRSYQRAALALRRLTLDELGILPDIVKIEEMKASYAIDKKPQTVASGGMIYASGGQMIDFSPKGTDTVPAMLTPGEFVINKAATAKNLPLLQSINRNAGGMVYLAQGGLAHLDGGGEASRYLDKDVARLLRIGERVATRTGWTLETNNNADTTLGLPDVTEQEFQLGQKRRPEMDSDEERGLKVYQESQLKKQEMAAENNAIAKDEAARQEREKAKADAKIASDTYEKTKKEVDAKQAKRELETQQSNKEKATAFDAETEGMKAGWAASANKREEAERLRQEQKDARTAEVAVLSKKREDETNARNRIAREAKEEQEAVMADKRTAAENSYHIDPVTGKMYETASGALINQQKVAQDILALQKATNNGNIGKKPKVKEATYSDGSHHGALALAEWEVAAKKKQELADLLITQGGMNKIKTSFDAELAQYIASTDADYQKYKQLYEANKLKPNQAIDYSIMGIRRGVNPNQLPAGAQASSRLRESLDAQNIKRIADAEHNKIKQDTRDEIAKGPQFTRFTGALANKAGSATASGVTSLTGSEMAGTVVGAAANVGTRLVTSILDPSQYVTPGLGMLTNTAVGAGSLVGAAAMAANAGDLQGAQGALAEAAISTGMGVAARGILGPAVKAPRKYGRLPLSLLPEKPSNTITNIGNTRAKYGARRIRVGSRSPAQVEQVGEHVPSGKLPRLNLPSLRDAKTGLFTIGDGTSQSTVNQGYAAHVEEVGAHVSTFRRDPDILESFPMGSPKPIRKTQDYPTGIRRSIRKAKSFRPTTYAAKGEMINFEPKGTDTVPAMLTPGEFVINKAATAKNLPLLQSINRNTGGMAYLVDGALVTKPKNTKPKTELQIAREAKQAEYKESQELRRTSYKEQQQAKADMYQGDKELARLEYDSSRPGSTGTYEEKKQNRLELAERLHTIGKPYEGSQPVNGYIADEIARLKKLDDTALPAEYQNDLTTLASKQKELTDLGEILNKKRLLSAKDQKYATDLSGHLQLVVNGFETIWSTMREKSGKDTPGWLKDMNTKAEPAQPPAPVAAARGGMIYANNGSLISARSQSSIDSIPAMLTPGEFVVNQRATQQNLPALQRLNAGGVVSPNYYANAGEVASQGGSGGSSSGIADLIGGAVSQFTASLTKVLDTYSVASNGGKNSPMATSQEVSSDGVKVDYDTIGAFTAKLANIAQVLGALDKIPDHITISGTHSVEVIINGDEALGRLSPGVQGIVTAAINTAMKKLVDDNPSLQGSVDVPKQP